MSKHKNNEAFLFIALKCSLFIISPYTVYIYLSLYHQSCITNGNSSRDIPQFSDSFIYRRCLHFDDRNTGKTELIYSSVCEPMTPFKDAFVYSRPLRLTVYIANNEHAYRRTWTHVSVFTDSKNDVYARKMCNCTSL